MTKRAVTYARCSGNDKSKTGGENLADQTKLCRQYAVERGYKVIADLAENDRGASGATFDLPQLSVALKMANDGEYDVLVVRELDRLSRDLAKQLIVEQELQQAGVTIEYVLYDFPDTPEGRLNKNLRAMLAEYEREKIKQRLLRGCKRRANAGNVVLHGHAPYGYKKTLQNGKTTLEIVEDEADIVRLIYQYYTVGDGINGPMSLRKIKRTLSAMKIPTASDLGKTSNPKLIRKYGEWSATTVSRMLSCETYVGRWYYGKDRILVEVPAIIDDETWEIAQNRKAQNRNRSKRNTKYNYLLQGRIRCADCHYMLRVSARKSHSSERMRFYYHCQTSQRDLPCTNKSNYRAEIVDALTWQWIKELLSEPKKLRDGLYDYKKGQESAIEPLRNRLVLVEKMIQEQQDKRDRILDAYIDGHISKEDFSERKARYDKTIAGLATQQEDLQLRLQEQEFTEERIQSIVDFAHTIREKLKGADNDFAAQRRLIELLDVTGELAFEKGERVLYLHCILDNGPVSFVLQSTSTGDTLFTEPTGTTTLGIL